MGSEKEGYLFPAPDTVVMMTSSIRQADPALELLRCTESYYSFEPSGNYRCRVLNISPPPPILLKELLRDLGGVEGQPQTLDINLGDDVFEHFLQRQAAGRPVSCSGRNGILQDGSTEGASRFSLGFKSSLLPSGDSNMGVFPLLHPAAPPSAHPAPGPATAPPPGATAPSPMAEAAEAPVVVFFLWLRVDLLATASLMLKRTLWTS
ncbi:hypothetical protein EYF80_031690 [Liparis tanakae]|uniref:Uncharacterized protein n=1 Tax=Liparis tanakae TaxID=230148 RepID=A0A4Z2GXQ7_9TELE|nr:hypothetical protein EYF80_031690 [Liparis tanakae]